MKLSIIALLLNFLTLPHCTDSLERDDVEIFGLKIEDEHEE